LVRAVVAYPTLAAEDSRKIEALRQQHDPNASRIAPHFTLVFPTGAIAEKALLKRMQDAAKQAPPFAVALKRILVHQESGESYLYLVPEAGYDALVTLHARLNQGDAGKPSFTPHVTVARLADRKQARAIATALATKHFAVNGRVEALTLVTVPEAGPVRKRRIVPLRA
jgi:2'-5' RNA ligase